MWKSCKRNFITNIETRIGASSETAIDHVISNLRSNQIKTGVIQFEATDHFPIFGIPKLHLPILNSEPPKFRRIFDENKQPEFCSTLQSKLQSANYFTTANFDPSSTLESVIQHIQATYNETFPLKKLSRKACKRYRKPWINVCILKQIKRKH